MGPQTETSLPPLNEVQKAKLVIKLDELKREKVKLESELSDMRIFHLSAAAEYGSELSAGGMEADERRLADQIRHVESVLAAVYLCLERGLDPGYASRLRQKIADTDQSIADLRESKKTTQHQLQLVELLESFLA